MSLAIAMFVATTSLLTAHAEAAQKQGASKIRQERAVLCAREGGHCSFQGVATVRYGARGRYVTREFLGGVPCSSEIFGDPYPGIRKSCFFLVLGVGY